MYWLHWLVWGLLFGIGMGLFLLKHTLVVLSEALRLTPAPPPPGRPCRPPRPAPRTEDLW